MPWWGEVVEVLSKGWFGSVLGLIGIVLAFVFYFRSLGRIELAFQHDTVHLIGGRGAAFPAEVHVIFAGKPVSHVAMTRVVLWNAGNRTVTGADIVPADPLRLRVSADCIILKQDVIRESRAVNRLTIEPSSELSNDLVVTFDFLDPDVAQRSKSCIQVIPSL
jgi:hypothetical protein